MEILNHSSSGFTFRSEKFLSGFGRQTLVALFGDAQLDAFAFRQRDVRFGALSDDENIRQTGGKHVTVGVLHVNDLERSRMLLAVDDGADTSQISSSGDHDQVSCKMEIFSKESWRIRWTF